LLGGPQAGIIAGKAECVAALKREPIFRALRCDKLILSALETAVDIYMRESHGDSSRLNSARKEKFAGVPVIEMLRLSNDELRLRASQMVSALAGFPVTAAIGIGKSQVGGGTLPQAVLASVTLDLTHGKLKPQEMAARLREHEVPIIGYVAHGKLKLDLRTIFPSQDAEVIKAIRALVV
jgi:L-seryl-tRNA(Ser) seleniumtransferase